MSATHHAPNEVDVGVAREVDVLETNISRASSILKKRGGRSNMFCRLPGNMVVWVVCM